MAHVYKRLHSFDTLVFGFFNNSFAGKERRQGHIVQAGYQKGAEFARTNLIFTVMDIPGTASELTVSCFEQNLTNVSTNNRTGFWF